MDGSEVNSETYTIMQDGIMNTTKSAMSRHKTPLREHSEVNSVVQLKEMQSLQPALKLTYQDTAEASQLNIS
jgi:hypothetical protein